MDKNCSDFGSEFDPTDESSKGQRTPKDNADVDHLLTDQDLGDITDLTDEQLIEGLERLEAARKFDLAGDRFQQVVDPNNLSQTQKLRLLLESGETVDWEDEDPFSPQS